MAATRALLLANVDAVAAAAAMVAGTTRDLRARRRRRLASKAACVVILGWVLTDWERGRVGFGAGWGSVCSLEGRGGEYAYGACLH